MIVNSQNIRRHDGVPSALLPPTHYRLLTSRAFLIVELLIALGLFVLVFTLMGGALVAGQQSESFAGNRSRALLLATEGLEAVRSISASGWSNLSSGSYGLVASSSRWILASSSDSVGNFTRQLTIADLDLKTKRVTSRVSWFSLPTKNEAVTLTEDFTNWRASWLATSTEQGALDLSGGQDAIKLAVNGNYAYIIFRAVPQNFAVITIATPTSPAIVNTASLSNEPNNLVARGNYVYVASKNNSEELQVINISNPTTPTQIASYNANGNADGLGIAATGTIVLLGRDDSSQDEFLLLNVATPTSPTLLGSLDLGSDIEVREIVVIDRYAYLSVINDGAGELKVINIATPTAPILAASLNLSNDDGAITVAGVGAVVAIGLNSNGGLRLINVATPTSPTLLASFAVTGDINDVIFGRSGTHVFLATTQSDREFQVVNLTTPTAPTLLSSFNTSGSLTGIDYQASQDYIYTVGQDNSAEFLSFKPNQP